MMNDQLIFIESVIVIAFLGVLSEISCIRFSTRRTIVNGFNKPIEPKAGEFPYQAALVAQVNGTQLIFCGGSLIHPRWILTAAHCLEQDGKQFPPHMLKVSVGSIYADLRGGQIRNVQKVIIHKGYFDTYGSHDIGLLKLQKIVKLSKLANLIAMHTNESETLLGQTVYLTGLGAINDFFHKPLRLRKAILHVNTPNNCLINSKDDSTKLCCTSTIYEGKACKGDSGGALIMTKNGKKYQVGITSHLAILPFCKITFNHSVYTKVAAYIIWISAKTGIDFYKYSRNIS